MIKFIIIIVIIIKVIKFIYYDFQFSFLKIDSLFQDHLLLIIHILIHQILFLKLKFIYYFKFSNSNFNF